MCTAMLTGDALLIASGAAILTGLRLTAHEPNVSNEATAHAYKQVDKTGKKT